MPDYAELEIFLYRGGEAEYSAVFKWRKPADEKDFAEEVAPIRLEMSVFDDPALLHDPIAYGFKLGQQLFNQPKAREAFIKARPEDKSPLRLRLCFDQRSLKLHRLRWETLRFPNNSDSTDPGDAECLATSGRVFLSRHLFSGDMRAVRLRPQEEMRAMIAVANPTNIEAYSAGPTPLAKLDVNQERDTALKGWGKQWKEELISDIPAGNVVTLPKLLAALRTEPDILYLVCHGALDQGEPKLLLQKEDGTGAVASGAELISALKGLQVLPRLAVLISCQSAGNAAPAPADAAAAPAPGDAAAALTAAKDRNVLAALGPRLAEAGIPAVIAMQGNLPATAAKSFLKAFFAGLREHGRVDEAVSQGRRAVKDDGLPGWWMPVLFTRLVAGRIWFEKGMKADFDAWPELVQQVEDGFCVPILGSGLLEPFIGTSRELTNRLALTEGYPLSLSGREELPDVLQYIATMRTENYAKSRLIARMKEAIQGRFPELGQHETVDELLLAAWKLHQAERPHEPHRYLAQLGRFKTIVNTNPDRVMEVALGQAGRAPTAFAFRWDQEGQVVFLHPEAEPVTAAFPVPPRPPTINMPTYASPHVYKLYGQFTDPSSMVATEDNFFRFLTSMTRRGIQKKNETSHDGDLADTLLRGTLAARALVFLGFRLTDWDFRTLFRLLIEQNGKNGPVKLTHIAVQIDPEDGTNRGAVQARRYIEKLFNELIGDMKLGKIAIYWGSAEDFIKDFDHRWQQEH
jgi:hypothetical protein